MKDINTAQNIVKDHTTDRSPASEGDKVVKCSPSNNGTHKNGSESHVKEVHDEPGNNYN